MQTAGLRYVRSAHDYLYENSFVESEEDSQLENVHVSSYRQHPQLKLVNKFGNLNSIKLFMTIYIAYTHARNQRMYSMVTACRLPCCPAEHTVTGYRVVQQNIRLQVTVLSSRMYGMVTTS